MAEPTRQEPSRSNPRKPCPICGKPASADNHPFCSPRCADVDLHRWLGGHYAVPGRPESPEATDLADEQD